jgi:hypothetical protein
MSPEVEEVIVDADVIEAQYVAEDLAQRHLGRRLG